LQAVLSILVDASGAFSNIQHRLFPTFALLGVAIVVDTLGTKIVPAIKGRMTRIAIGLAVSFITALSLIKATNEPALVNYWSFYTAPEITAVRWVDERTENSSVWSGYNSRLAYAIQTVQGGSVANNTFTSAYSSWMPYVLVSDLSRQLGVRIQGPLPPLSMSLAIYDNGTTQIYHRRPLSPYQH
jgi:hypothetical protein